MLVDHAPTRGWPRPAELFADLGPQSEWFTAESLTLLKAQTYRVSSDSNRVGVRLTGEPLTRSVREEMMSEPVIRGAIEVTIDGQLIMFMSDHPTTCGYPVIAVLDAKSADDAAQLRPGDAVRLHVGRSRRKLP
jgi:allophanate hydrolase subunit 2